LPSVDKVKEATQKLIELFKSGNLPPAIARTTIRAKAGHEVPSDSWSLGNRLLMLLAGTEDARGFKQWQKVGRKVKKGAKAFYILAPRMVKTEDNTTGEEKLVIAGFLSVPVFRYEHTEGEEIIYPDYSPPALPPLSDVAGPSSLIRCCRALRDQSEVRGVLRQVLRSLYTIQGRHLTLFPRRRSILSRTSSCSP